ncbi:hypothetical protein [Mesorhizobium sp. M0159]|uniref:hypothetical protein n=1 Tax=unclassified Mesorhizobium TaxID=325217 RepID=UPI003336DE34
MDQVKLAGSRLRRLQTALAPPNGREEFLAQPLLVRPLAITRGPLELRKVIDENVVAFLPPVMPLLSPGLACTEALVEFTRSGHWKLNVQVEAQVAIPVALVAGFATNEHCYFGGLIAGVNISGPASEGTSPTSSGAFSIKGYSRWIEDDFIAARDEGVTIRVHSSIDLQGRIHALVGEWGRKFDKALYRPLSLLDTDYSDTTAWEVPNMIEGANLDLAGPDDGLSFEVSLRFE